MPRLVQSVPKYQKHRASGQAVVTINGRDHYLGPHGTKASKLNYDRLITEWLSSGRSASYGAPERDYTVVELIAVYLRYAKSYYGDGPRSSAAAMTYAVRPLKELYGRTTAAEFGPLQFQGSSPVPHGDRRFPVLRQPDDAADRSRVSLGGRVMFAASGRSGSDFLPLGMQPPAAGRRRGYLRRR